MKTASVITKKIDFSGLFPKLERYSGFEGKVMESLRREARAGNAGIALVIDRSYGLQDNDPAIVTSHLNLTGSNPLFGPNDDVGERFPVLEGTYVEPPNSWLRRVVVAGLKPGCNPTIQEIEMIHKVGADCWCYNLIPTMIVAAHAGFRVIGVLVPVKDAQSTNEIRQRFLEQLPQLGLDVR
jgi:purine-nucleoside phosphorylase